MAGRKLTPEERIETFWRRVDRSCGPDACWPWTGYRTQDGYGTIAVDRKDRGTHRFAWMVTNGPIPSGLEVCHACNNPPCCNPKHLYTDSHRGNIKYMFACGRNVPLFGTPGFLARPRDGITPRGESNGAAKLTEANVREARIRLARGENCASIARSLGVITDTIALIKHRKTWAWLK